MAGDLYDFHSHILPGIDDGYRDEQSAIAALKLSYAQGVRYMVATPHYYADEPAERFVQRRDEAYARLQKAMEEDGGQFPEICLGAEVAYYPNISYYEDLHRLCIGKSNYLLLELPMSKWGIEVMRDIQSICNAGEVILVLAHIDRYLSIQNQKTLQQVFCQELLLQMGAEFVLDRKTRRQARRMLKENPAYLLGSDCHNLNDRKPNLGDAAQLLGKHRMDFAVWQAMELSEEIWSDIVG